jgi:hypothetical protein
VAAKAARAAHLVVAASARGNGEACGEFPFSEGELKKQISWPFSHSSKYPHLIE